MEEGIDSPPPSSSSNFSLPPPSSSFKFLHVESKSFVTADDLFPALPDEKKRLVRVTGLKPDTALKEILMRSINDGALEKVVHDRNSGLVDLYFLEPLGAFTFVNFDPNRLSPYHAAFPQNQPLPVSAAIVAVIATKNATRRILVSSEDNHEQVIPEAQKFGQIEADFDVSEYGQRKLTSFSFLSIHDAVVVSSRIIFFLIYLSFLIVCSASS